MRLFYAIAIFGLSGCAGFIDTASILRSDASSTQLREVVINGILLAHPEFDREQAEAEAVAFIAENRQYITDAYIRMIDSDEYTRAVAALNISRLIYAMIRVQDGERIE